jgi:hypothetical protein
VPKPGLRYPPPEEEAEGQVVDAVTTASGRVGPAAATRGGP